ncbi:hypothetical protein D5086_004925 [Populus alba]|uniref:Uncharacterized protein n=1 Tax=Populus alba TaxID=43335 RepID=A0ACC4CRU3_POPAL
MANPRSSVQLQPMKPVGFRFHPTHEELGQYVLCRLKKKPDEKTKKGEQNHHMTAVSDSDAEPSQTTPLSCFQLPTEVSASPFFQDQIPVLGRVMNSDFSSVMADPLSLMQLMKAGFKFQPSPEELIINYLVPKSRGGIVEGVPMAEVNLCEHEPWDLPNRSIINLADQEWYFFCPRDLKYKKKSRLCNRKTKAGYWKSTCKIKPIMAGHTKKNIGVMKTLAFYKKARPKDVRTGWMIYEFDIVTNSSLSKKGQYVLCRLENRSDERIKKGEQNHLMASVSVSEAVPDLAYFMVDAALSDCIHSMQLQAANI